MDSRTWPFVFNGVCRFGLVWRIAKCMVKSIAFKCYLFGNAFGDGVYPQKVGVKNLVGFSNIFLGLIIGG